ncbi:MAG TPA: histidine kinase dimerization/phospho-acceptor domain-containing protein [Chitinophagaceae bacterium]|nr:histidine kinase dimerization/phospho-acceptor domain-containing protein [Chitinophagaceae bacterium]
MEDYNKDPNASSDKLIKEKEKLVEIQRAAKKIVHDLKNHVTNIDLSVKQLEEEVDLKDLKSYLDIIKRNNDKIHKQIDELLHTTNYL